MPQPDKPEKSNAADGAQKRQAGPVLKTTIVLLAVLLLEGATIGISVLVFGGPREVQGAGPGQGGRAAADRVVELLVVEDKFPNLQTGRQFLYDTEVYITARPAQAQTVKDDLKAMYAQIAMDIGTIVRAAHPSYFKEPTLATLRRQIKAALDERLGEDAEGRSFIQDVLVTKCIPFRSDF